MIKKVFDTIFIVSLIVMIVSFIIGMIEVVYIQWLFI